MAVFLFGAVALVHAAQVYDLIDDTVNQPTVLTDNDGVSWGIFPVPTGYTCTANFGTHCEATTATTIGNNLMKRFLAINNTSPMADGNYTFVREAIQCPNNESLADCKARSGNNFQEFTVPYATSGPPVAPTDTTSTLSSGDAVNWEIFFILEALVFVGAAWGVTRLIKNYFGL